MIPLDEHNMSSGWTLKTPKEQEAVCLTILTLGSPVSRAVADQHITLGYVSCGAASTNLASIARVQAKAPFHLGLGQLCYVRCQSLESGQGGGLQTPAYAK